MQPNTSYGAAAPSGGSFPPDAAPPSAGSGKIRCDRRDAGFAAICFALGVTFCEFVLFGGMGAAVPVFLLPFYAAALAYFKKKHRVLTRRSAAALVPAALIALCFALFDNSWLRALNLPVLWALVILSVLCMADGARNETKNPVFTPAAFARILRATFVLPFGNFDKAPRVLVRAGNVSGGRKTVLGVLGALLAASPVVLLVVSLLASSDSGFANLVSGLLRGLSDEFWTQFFRVLLGLFLALPLFSLFYSLRYEKEKEAKVSTVWRGPVENFMLTAVLLLFCGIYLIYVTVQAGYLFSALAGRLPAGFTYAEYARRGFFELTGVVFINFLLILAAALLTRGRTRGAAAFRAAASALAGFTFLLTGTAASKMGLYIARFGLTPLRIYVLWILVTFALLTALLLFKIWKPAVSFFRLSVLCVGALYLALNFANVDGIVADCNLARYRADTKSTLDVSLFSELSDSAVAKLSPLANDAQYGQAVTQIVRQRAFVLLRGDWSGCTVEGAAALQTMRQNAPDAVSQAADEIKNIP